MKSEIIKNKEKSEYPKLMVRRNINTNTYIVVLFKCKNVGTIINTNSGDHEIGIFSHNWIMGEFENFNDSIILSN
jgi:hypothetical protein